MAILQAFADVPEVLQPVGCDARRIVMPWLDARPVELIDEQPGEPAVLDTPVLRYRVAAAMTRVLSAYHERREDLYRRFANDIPERYREEVRTGKRLLVDLCRSNILITREGQVRFVDFEPSKPPLTERIVRELQELCDPAPRRRWW